MFSCLGEIGAAQLFPLEESWGLARREAGCSGQSGSIRLGRVSAAATLLALAALLQKKPDPVEDPAHACSHRIALRTWSQPPGCKQLLYHQTWQSLRCWLSLNAVFYTAQDCPRGAGDNAGAWDVMR